METLHRLAGIEATSEQQDEPSQPLPNPPPIPHDGDEKSGSRVSLPLSRRHSHKSSKSVKSTRSGHRSREDLIATSSEPLPQTPRTPLTPRAEERKHDEEKPEEKTDGETDTEAEHDKENEAPAPPDKDAPPPPEKDAPAPPAKDEYLNDDSQTQPPPQTQDNRQRQASTSSQRSGTSTSGEEFTWGPSHPCFPHPNPYCSPTSPEASSTRVVRVKRDFLAAGDLYPAYANLYPEILDPLVSDADFRTLVSSLNVLCRETFDVFTTAGRTRVWLDAALGMLTGWIWEDLGLTGVKAGEKRIEALIARWNEGKRREGIDVRAVQLRESGYTCLDFVIPDPGIDEAPFDAEEDEDAEEGREGIAGV